MPTNRPSIIAGLALIALGIVFLITFFLPNAWPIVLIALGVCFLVVAAIWRVTWPVLTGLIITSLGGILLYQTITQKWDSWYFLWPLLFAALGLGLLLTRQLERLPGDIRSSRYVRVSWAWLALGLLAAVVLWVFRAQVSWPSIICGMGAMFLLAALLSSIGPLAIPGTIFGGLGLLLAWQHATGDWASWAYTWALLPALVGLGLLLAFLRHRTVRTVGLSMLIWGLVVFALFGLIFAGQGVNARLWPIGLILAGLAVLVQTLVVRHPGTNLRRE